MVHPRDGETDVMRLRQWMEDETMPEDLICFSHLRWNFVYQRPQHLLTRAARDRRVFFFEEPLLEQAGAGLMFSHPQRNLVVVTPLLPTGLDAEQVTTALRYRLDKLIELYDVRDYMAWYYTPMALSFSDHLRPAATVYDCMDELSAFKGAPDVMSDYEYRLLRRADLVFAGGRSLYASKHTQHPRVHLFPSSVDAKHFERARKALPDPPDQATIAHPRLGFFGVIDERMDLDLIAGVADARPDFQLVLVGPVTKIEPAALPQRPNIHYLGGKLYSELPAYLAGWDVAMLPFALNESTRFISPTKTPEYLAAGRPVVSTSVPDVVEDYGRTGAVQIADSAEDFIRAAEVAMAEAPSVRLARADRVLAGMSWDRTWRAMDRVMQGAIAERKAARAGVRRRPDGAAIPRVASGGAR